MKGMVDGGGVNIYIGRVLSRARTSSLCIPTCCVVSIQKTAKMKFLLASSLLAASASAHYTFPALIAGGKTVCLGLFSPHSSSVQVLGIPLLQNNTRKRAPFPCPQQ